MKIALLTYFASSSYGATLQTYATIKILKELGHEVELVDYVIPEPPRSRIKNILMIPKMFGLKQFRNKYGCTYSKSYKSIADLQNNPPKADVYMIGSDQTWNTDISREMARGFFLDFGNADVKRVTYAASFGKEEWIDNQWMNKEDARKLLGKFDHILIREKTGQRILKDTFGLDSVQVVDPVLLFPNYPELTGQLNEVNEISTFKLLDSSVFYAKMRELSKALDLPVRIVGSMRRKRGFLCSYPERVENWIKRIASAKYVVTDSFHGLVISILYHRNFLVYQAIPERFTRLKDLLEMLGLNGRIVSLNDDTPSLLDKIKSPINWGAVDQILGENRKKSIQLMLDELK